MDSLLTLESFLIINILINIDFYLFFSMSNVFKFINYLFFFVTYNSSVNLLLKVYFMPKHRSITSGGSCHFLSIFKNNGWDLGDKRILNNQNTIFRDSFIFSYLFYSKKRIFDLKLVYWWINRIHSISATDYIGRENRFWRQAYFGFLYVKGDPDSPAFMC